MKSMTSLWASTPVFFLHGDRHAVGLPERIERSQGPVTMCQLGSAPSCVVAQDLRLGRLGQGAFGSVLTVTNSTSAASAPRSCSACSISAASTGQMSLQRRVEEGQDDDAWR